MTDVNDSIRLTEIFHSLQGESLHTGLPTVFVRLTGCPLRCHYCDTTYAFKGGERYSIASILEKVSAWDCPYVCVTGGEPLAQPNCLPLMKALCDAGFRVSIETSGALDISSIDQRVMVVMDIKTPDSGEVSKNLYSNFQYLKPDDQIKFVLCSEKDYLWANALIKEFDLTKCCALLYSPAWDDLRPADLAAWIIRDRLPVRFQLQMHKVLNIP